jgi:hypothetical protein
MSGWLRKEVGATIDVGAPNEDVRSFLFMSDPKKLRRNAQDCLTHTQAATDARDKFLLLNMAQAWLKLSQQVEQVQAEREMASRA